MPCICMFLKRYITCIWHYSFKQLPAATTIGLWQANHLHGACWEWCLLFQRLLPFYRLTIGGQTEGRDCIMLALTFWCSRSMICLDETYTFGLGINFIDAPVYFWIFSAWTGIRFQTLPCVQQRSALRAGVLRHDCRILTLYFHFETPRKFGRRSLKNADGNSIGMEHRAIAANLRYVIL